MRLLALLALIACDVKSSPTERMPAPTPAELERQETLDAQRRYRELKTVAQVWVPKKGEPFYPATVDVMALGDGPKGPDTLVFVTDHCNKEAMARFVDEHGEAVHVALRLSKVACMREGENPTMELVDISQM